MPYAYDDEGNVASKTRISDGRYWSYAYDHRNQMTGATEKSSAAGAVLQTLTYTLDVYGNAVKRVSSVSGERRFGWRIADASPGVTKSVHELEMELNAANVVTKRWLNGDGANERWLSESAGSTNWLLTDRQGSVRDVTNVAGTIVDTVTYTAFGGIASESTPALGSDAGFSGGWALPTPLAQLRPRQRAVDNRRPARLRGGRCQPPEIRGEQCDEWRRSDGVGR